MGQALRPTQGRELPPRGQLSPLPHQEDGSPSRGRDVDRTRAKDIIITHLWEPQPCLEMAGPFWLSLPIPAGTWEKGAPVPSPRLEEQKEQSGPWAERGRQKTFINDPLSCLRDTF